MVTIVLNSIAVCKQEPRNRARAMAPPKAVGFRESWRQLAAGKGMLRLLAVIGLGTAGFGMADVLLEPFGGQVLQMTVAQTTKLTVVLASGSLVGFALASRWLGQGGRPINVAMTSAVIGAAAIGFMIEAAVTLSNPLVVGATLAAGFGAGLFGHGTLTATMRRAPQDQIGLALGAWRAVQTRAAGISIAIGGVLRDLMMLREGPTALPADAYIPVFWLEFVLLVGCIIVAKALTADIVTLPRKEPFADTNSQDGPEIGLTLPDT